MEWIVARWLSFVATLLIAGACAVAIALLPRAAADDADRIDIARDTSRIALIACALMVPASLLRLLDQVLALRSPGDPMVQGLRALLGSTTWGTGFLWQSAALLVCAIGIALASRAPTSRRWWLLAAIGALGLCATPSMQGHAIGSEERTAIAVAADVTHVLGAAVWLGTIGVIGLLGLVLWNADGGETAAVRVSAESRLRVLVPILPPVVLPGAAALIVSGLVSSWLKLRSPADLWREPWGRYVLLKAVFACAIVALGALNWKRLGRRLHDTDGVRALRRALGVELLLALLVLMITALLVVTPLPGERDEASADGVAADGVPMAFVMSAATRRPDRHHAPR